VKVLFKILEEIEADIAKVETGIAEMTMISEEARCT